MPPVRSIFFDIGDTLVFDDPPLPLRVAQAAQAVGVTLDAARLPSAFHLGERFAVARYIQGIPWDAPDTVRGALARIWRALDLPPASDDWQSLLAAFAATPFTRYVHPDAPALLADLKARGFVLGAASDWEATLPDLLRDLGIAPYLNALAVSAAVGVTKPDPRLFREALRQAGAVAATALHVGDWYELDVLGARAAGMQALLFDHAGRHPDADCPRVQTFDALAAYLRRLDAP